MRLPAFALLLSLALMGPVSAATKHKAKTESPPTARPDATLVAPDTTPPPATTAAPTRPVEMQPIGATGAATRAAVTAPTPAPPPPPAPAAPPPPAAIARAEACLRTEAPRAARVEASVKLAVDLLLEDLCGGEVERAALYVHNAEALARFTPQSERAAAGLASARVDPETGEIVNPPAGDVAGALSAAEVGRGEVETPPQLRRFAADLVIEAKTRPVGKPTDAKKPS